MAVAPFLLAEWIQLSSKVRWVWVAQALVRCEVAIFRVKAARSLIEQANRLAGSTEWTPGWGQTVAVSADREAAEADLLAEVLLWRAEAAVRGLNCI